MIDHYKGGRNLETERATKEMDKSHEEAALIEKYKLKIAMVKNFKKEFKNNWLKGVHGK